MGIKVIKNYKEKSLKCGHCGETRSVKYTSEVFDVLTGKSVEVCMCNRCALDYKHKGYFLFREGIYEDSNA